eukprot:gene18152-13030_t
MACLPSFANIVFSEANDDAAGVAAVVVARSTIIDYDYSGRAGEKRYPPRVNRDIPDGCRLAETYADAWLRPEHDIAALQWLCAQYHPTKVELRATWSSCVTELLSGSRPLVDVADRLAAYDSEALEPADRSTTGI